MTALLLVSTGNPQHAIQTPQGLKHGYEPFWGSHWWLADNARRRGALITVQEYRNRVLGSSDEALKMRCAERGMQPKQSREATIAMLLKGMSVEEVGEPEPYTTATYYELVTECGLRGITHGTREEMIDRLTEADGGGQQAGKLDGAHEDEAHDSHTEDAAEAKSDEVDGVPAAPEPASQPPLAIDQDLVAQLGAALEADDYNQVWSVSTNLTEDRPESKTKPVLMAWARSLYDTLKQG